MRLRYVGYFLTLAGPAALVAHWLGADPLTIFVLAGVAIVPLAAWMGRATESLATYVGPRLGGLLSASFGNAAELIIGLLALRRGLTAVVKASLTGSIIGNALFVVGLSLLVGGLRNGRQRFDRANVGLQSTLLVVASIGLAIPSVLFYTLREGNEILLSEEVAGILFGTYVLNLVFTVLGRSDDQASKTIACSTEAAKPDWTLRLTIGILLGATAAIALLAEVLVSAVDQAQKSGQLEVWGISEVFVGVVLVALIGNAAENSAAILMAFRNKTDLALHIALGASLQISLLVMPVLVFASIFIGPTTLDLHFTMMEVLAVSFSVVIVAFVAADGESHWMEGVLLLAVYLILAMAFYHLPDAVRKH